MPEIRHVQVKLDGELAEWFDNNCTIFSKQDFIERCFLALRDAVERKRIPHPSIYTDAVAMMAAFTLTPPEENGALPVRPTSDQT